MARCGSLSRAAEHLGVAQPALSRQVMKLEAELGLPLLERHGRGVRLTAAGSLLLQRAETILAEVSRIPHDLRSAGTAVTGHVVLGVPPAAGLIVAPAVYRAFRARWPDAVLQIREGISSLLEEWLLDGRLDVAVLHNPPPLDGVAITPVLQERMVVAHPVSVAKEAARPLRLSEIGGVPLILPSLPHSNRRLVERAAAQHGTRLQVVIEVDSVPLTKALVEGGFGSTILTFAGVAQERAAGRLVAQAIDHPPLLSTVAVGAAHAPRPSWLAEALALMVVDEIRDLVRSAIWVGARLIENRSSPDFAP